MLHDDSIKTIVRKLVARGGQLFLADRAPSAFNDFVFGLSEGWFEDSQSPEFPVGRLGTVEQIEDLLAALGFAKAQVRELTFPEGSLIAASAVAEPRPEAISPAEISEPLLVLSEQGRKGMVGLDKRIAVVEVGSSQAEAADALRRLVRIRIDRLCREFEAGSRPD